MERINEYVALRERQQQEVNDFPMVFAFNHQQFIEGMHQLGLKATDTDKVYSLGNLGGIYRKSDAEALHAMIDRHASELEAGIKSDTDGTGFAYDMFRYELANHEYCVTYDLEPTLDACGLTIIEVNDSPILKKALNAAKRDYMTAVHRQYGRRYDYTD